MSIDGASLGDTLHQVTAMMLITVWVFIARGAAIYTKQARAAATSAGPLSASSACWPCCCW